MSRDTWQGNYNKPLSLNRWNYVGGNPVNYVDPTGRNPNCLWLVWGKARCANERYYEIVSKDPATAHKNALTLVALFEDKELNTLWVDAAGRSAYVRMLWILGMTRGHEDGGLTDTCTYLLGIPMQFHNNLEEFGNDDNYFEEGLRDNKFYSSSYWDHPKGNRPSNQVGHFLTAVAMSLEQNIVAYTLMIAHELATDNGEDGGGVLSQLNALRLSDRKQQLFQDFTDAIEADERRDTYTRDQKLWDILGFPASVAFGAVPPDREGNSLQDLRLSVKGYRFGKWTGYSGASPQEGGSWLRQNILKTWGPVIGSR